MTGAPTVPSPTAPWRVLLRAGARALAGALAAAALVPVQPAQAQDVKADVSVNVAGGYTRLVFHFSEDIDTDVRLSSGVLVLTFTRPVDVAVDRLSTVAGYTSAARRDPDRKGLRIALTRKVTINSMTAGERLFVDLLPESWTGPPPPLPQEIVEDLARRTREAEKKARQQQALARQRARVANRVRVSQQPTFTRYVFELPELVSVSTDRGKDKLTLQFDAGLKFDLADVKAAQSPLVQSIEATPGETSTAVTLSFVGQVDVRTFREDNNYVVDVVAVEAKKREEAADAGGSDAASEAAPPPSRFAHDLMSAPAETARAPTPSAARKSAADGQAAAEDRTPRTEALDALRPNPGDMVKVALRRQDDNLRLTFPFGMPTPAAAFTRGDTFWMVFDTRAAIDVSALRNNPLIRETTVAGVGSAQSVRIKFDRPRLFGLRVDDYDWVLNVADAIAEPSQPLGVVRSTASELRASAQIPFDGPRQIHRLEDPDAGDLLIVVTALGPARGMVKTQDFVEFRALASVHGVVLDPLADDLAIELAADRVMIGRPGGLTLSQSGPGARRAGLLRPTVFDAQVWSTDRAANFNTRLLQLVVGASEASGANRTPARLDLARFYAARGMYEEAKGVLDVALAEERPTADDTIGLVMRGVAKTLMGRPEEALQDLGDALVGNQNDAQLWRALAAARLGKWTEAREGFRKTEVAIGMLPIELQREIQKEQLRASIELNDFAAASGQLNEFESLGVTAQEMPVLSVLAGRIHEGLGHSADALQAYRTAADSPDRAVAAQGRLREIAVRYQLGDLKRADVITELETLTAVWRGDETEVEALQMLARLYTQDGRYRSAFNVMQTALQSHANSDMTRRIQDEAVATFDSLFLGGKGDAMPAIEALSLFYDFRSLTPIGKRGDEMIRRLADRLVSIDLLAQAAELLQHQVDHRLQGAARAQVAARLAAIYLLSHKPERVLAVLRTTRSTEMSTDLRAYRLLLEARALSEIGRPGLALEVVQNIEGPEAQRLRADILWTAKRYREAAEQFELLFGERWRDWQPLNDVERRDVLKACIGFALGEDQIGLARFREKFAPVMAAGPDRKAFEVVSNPLSASSAEFREVARSIAAIDTLDQFLKEIRTRYPETAATLLPSRAGSGGVTMTPARPDFAPTGSIPAANGPSY